MHAILNISPIIYEHYECNYASDMHGQVHVLAGTGDFNPRRTLSGSFFVITERLASIRSVVLVFTANKQTNTLKYIKII